MRFYYRIYQKTKVLTRKRKSKKTKTNNKGQPTKKRRNTESTEVAAGVDSQENGVEMEQESRKAASNLRTDSGEERVRTKGATSKERPKGESVKMKLSSEPAKPVKGTAAKPVTSGPVLPKTGEGKLVQNKPVNGKPVPAGKPVLSGKPVNGAKPVVKPVPGAKPAQGAKLLPGAKPSVSQAAKAGVSKGGNPSKPVSSQSSSQPAVSKPSAAKLVSSGVGGGKAGLSAGKSVTEEKSRVRSSAPVETPVSKTVSSNNVKTTSTNSTSNSESRKEQKKEKESFPSAPEAIRSSSDKEKSSVQTGKQVSKEPKVGSSKADPKVKPGAEVAPASNNMKKNGVEVAANNKTNSSDKEVVEISVEVSASDVKKVLEKKKAEKDAARLTSNGEEKLYSNYSIVDQLKKGAAAASLARQKQASMMDFTRSSEALNAPKVPPTIQGLQPKVSSAGETNVLSAIVHSLAQKQQSLNQKIQAVTGKPEASKEKRETVSPGLKSNSSPGIKLKDTAAEGTKTLGTILAPGLAKPQNGVDKVQKNNSNGATESPASSKLQLPTSTSIKPIEPRKSPAPVDTAGSKGQQMLNFYKNNFPKAGSDTEVKSTETLTRNIPAGTTVTVKTVDNRQPRSSPSSNGSSKTSSFSSSSSSSSAFRMNLSNSVGKQQQSPNSPFGPTSAPSSPLIPPFMPSPLTMALAAQQQYLNFSNQHAALTAQMEAANYIKAMQAAQAISTTPVTSLAFTKPISSSGLKIPQPPMSGFGTSRLQLKVNQDSPTMELPPTSSPKPASPVPRPAHHSMPAMLPFHGVKKVQALPKSSAQTRTIPSLLSRPSLPISSSGPPPAKKQATPTTILHSTLKGPNTNPQPNSLKKLVADLKTAQQKDLKTENMLSSLKKSNENKLLSDTKKSFVGLDIRPVESKKSHEVSTS